MDSRASTPLFSSPLELQDQKYYGCSPIDLSPSRKLTNVPIEFVWPKRDLVNAHEELMEPIVDLEGFLRGDEETTQKAAKIIRAACLSHGFFQVINHGVDSCLISAAYHHMDLFFKLPLSEKLKARKMPGNIGGYSGDYANRFSSKLPWKEALTFGFHKNSSNPVVVDFFQSKLGKDFEETGKIYQKYCEAMKDSSLAIMELLAISLGVDRLHYRNFFEDGCAIMRCNYYPACQEPGLTLGTGPHCDPNSITILHQDQVGGLEVYTNNKWQIVQPRHDALVINIGETFTALSNGKYKSCLHRAVVNRYKDRRSLVFVFSPREDKIVIPPEDLVCSEGTRMYPDFTWTELLEFTQNHYRTDADTLKNFTNWLLSSKPVNI